MRSKLFLIFITVYLLAGLQPVLSQDCVRTGLNNTVVNSTCSQICRDLVFQIPDIRSTSSYTFVSTPYNPFPYVTAGGTQDPLLYDDDTYSNVFTLPFPFCFFDDIYTQAVVSSNGLVTLDPAYSACAPTQAAYIVNNPVPFNGTGANCSPGHYPRAAIMGIFMDLDPRSAANGTPSSPLDRKIEWRAEGTAPCRRFVVSFYHIGVYQATSCGQTTPATFQIILYESTGLIDVMIDNESCAPFTIGSNKAILGIQDFTRTKGLGAPGKNATLWSASREGFRFVPSGGVSRFVSSELLTMALAPVSVATSSISAPGLLDITFPAVCSPALSTQYIIRTTYSACDNPATLIVGLDTITVNRGPLNVTTASTATSCTSANDGTITATPVDGTAPYTYSLDGAAAAPGPAPVTFTNMSAGLHTVTAYDVSGCASLLLNIDVPAGPAVTTTATATNVLCNGSATGSITVVVPSVGTPPFQYSLDNVTWQASNVFNGLAANTYTVYYQSANGCQGTPIIVTVTAPASLSSSAATVAAVCNGQNNGTITVTANGGVGPYQYSINGGGTWQGSNVFNVPAGTYTITIRDANNCTTTQTATVTEPAALSASAGTSNASCNGGNDGVITVSASGGNAGYQYSLDGVSFQGSNIFNVAPGNYTVTVKDNLGCITTFNTTVGLTNDLTFTPQVDATICEGTSTQLNFTSNALQYAWSPATGLSSTIISNPVASPTVTTTYTVTATLGRCTATDDVIVNVNAAPVPDAGPDGFICYGQTYQLQGSGGSQYTWTPSTYLNSTTIANPVSSSPKTITYTLSEVIDAIGCKSLTTDDVIVDVTPPIKVNTFPFDTVAYAGDQFQLTATSIANIYTWSPAVRLSDPNIANPIVTVGGIGSDIVYQVTASTAAGCKGEGYVRIKVYTGPDIYVPTAFSPNGDGKNDRFTPFPVGIKSIKYFRVFNRWGQLVFSTTQLNDGWDGKLGGVEQPNGVYVWMVEGMTRTNKVITKKGTIMLLR